jgi:large conductance mechanosensitive channel
MLKGFRDFIMRGNVVDLAVGIVIGAAFTTVVSSFTGSFLQPVIRRLGGSGQFGGRVSIGGRQYLDWGGFVNALLTFLLTAAVLYLLVVYPMNKLARRRKRGEEPPPEAPSEEVRLLTDIRDALVRQAQAPQQRFAPEEAMPPRDSR